MNDRRRYQTTPPKTEDDFQNELNEAKSIVCKMAVSKRLVVGGFMICLLGITAYCYLTLFSPNHAKYLILPSLAVVAAGFVLWLVGAIRYFNLAIDCGDSDSIF